MSALYDQLARRLPHPDLLFLNYGLGGTAAAGPTRGDDRRHLLHLRLLRRVLGPTAVAGEPVLEVGCGRGGNCRYLAARAGARPVVGVDRSQGNIDLCRRQVAAGLAFVRADAERLPFRSGRFAVLLNLESAHGYRRFDAFLGEARRVLRPGGTLCFADLWGFRPVGVDWRRRERELARSGLEVVAEEDLSEEVFLALASEDGLPARLRRLAGRGHRRYAERLARSVEAVRLALALGSARYRLLRLRKPGPAPPPTLPSRPRRTET